LTPIEAGREVNMSINIYETECVKEFFNTVQEQICYKPVRKAACKELEDHIEDKTEEYIRSGMNEKMAVVQAVKEMGDPIALGVKMNETYSLQKDYKLLGLILLAVLGGIVSNAVYGYENSYSVYFFLGIAVLFAVMIYGYRFCVEHRKLLTAAAIVYGAVWGSYSIIQGILRVNYMAGIEEILWLWNVHNKGFLFTVIGKLFFSMTMRFNGMFLVIPLCAVLLYRGGNKKVAGLAASGVLILAVIAGAVAYPSSEYLLTAIVIVMIAYFGLSLTAVGKSLKVLIPVFVTLTCFACLLIGRGRVLKTSTELFVTPEKQAINPWEDGYNGVLIKELLGRAEFLGGIRLTEEELWEYGTGDWYFENGVDDFYHYHLSYKEHLTIEDILPQHYLNNYRIAYVIIKYGWAVGILFLAGLVGMIVLLFYTTYHIRNRLGFLMAFGSSMVLTMQIVFYTLGNFGYQLGMFPNLPFISEGMVSVIVNMMLAGLILSAYRYDRVIKEEPLSTWKIRRKTKNMSPV